VNWGGLGARAALKQKPTKPCERCGLRYPEDENECTHCSSISDSELPFFKEHIEAQYRAASSLGSVFFVIAIVLGVLLLLSF